MAELAAELTSNDYRHNPKIGNYPTLSCPYVKHRTLLMFGVEGERRPILYVSDDSLYNLGDPIIIRVAEVVYRPYDFLIMGRF